MRTAAQADVAAPDAIYVVSEAEDDEAVAPLVVMLRSAGWDVHARHQTDRMSALSRSDRSLASARAVIVVWSASSVRSPRICALAEIAREANLLVSIRIDASAVPVSGGVLVDLSEGQSLSDGPGWRAIMTCLEERRSAANSLALAAPALRSGPASPTTSPVPDHVRSGLIAAALVLLLGALAGGGYWLYAARAAAIAKAGEGAASGEPASSAGASRVDKSEIEALTRWGQIDDTNAAAVRKFLAAYPDTPAAAFAAAALERIDRETWNRVTTAEGAEAILAAIDAYRSEFPDGRFLESASGMERNERRRISEVQMLLKALGYEPGDDTGVLHKETLTAITAVREKLGVEGSNIIDLRLLSALRSAAQAQVDPAVLAQLEGRQLAEDESAAEGEAAGVNIGGAGSASWADPVAGAGGAVREPAAFRDCYVCPEMAPLPLGAFDMGDATGKAPSFERPMHRVDIAYRLAVGRYEVTFEEWDACRADGGCKRDIDDMGWGRGRRPLINVGPEDAEAYLSWLRRKTGRAYRLLSEAEWEYAARAGSVSAWHTGNDPAALCVAGNGADASSAYAWRNGGCSDAFADRTAPVGSFQPNAFGLYDMIGNAWEWTADCWHANYEGAPANGSAWTTECSKPDRVLRGGAFSVDVDKMRSSSRYAFAAQPMPFFGFRVARPME